MSDDKALVLVAAYQDEELAQKEFDAFVGLVAAKSISTDGAILVAKNAEGAVRLSDTGDRLGRKGAGWEAASGSSSGYSPRRCWPRWRSVRPRARSWASLPTTS